MFISAIRTFLVKAGFDLDQSSVRKVIVYTHDNPWIAILVPSAEGLKKYGYKGLAKKHIPCGVPYAIVDRSSLPTDRMFRDAWVQDKDNLENVYVDERRAKDVAYDRCKAHYDQMITREDEESSQSESTRLFARHNKAFLLFQLEEVAEKIDNADSTKELRRIVDQYNQHKIIDVN